MMCPLQDLHSPQGAEFTPASLHGIATPALLLDRSILERNLEAMRQRAQALGVRLRPHLKTAKSLEIARRATAGAFGGICVSTLEEAGYFVHGGFTDICCPNVLNPAKVDGFATLVRRGAKVTVCVADPLGAALLVERAAALDAPIHVLIEIESGARRTGVDPDSPVLAEIGRIIHAGTTTTLAGVLTYAGQAYEARSVSEIRDVAEVERDAVMRAAARLKALSLPCPTVSVGSTPTATHARHFEGVTEIRPGNYMFLDLMQAEIGTSSIDRIAVSVLVTVLACDRDSGRIAVDAGALALSKETDLRRVGAPPGYGWVIAATGPASATGIYVAKLYQEHGVLAGSNPTFLRDLKTGSKLRILPYHACLTAAAYGHYHVVDGTDEVVDHWSKLTGTFH